MNQPKNEPSNKPQDNEEVISGKNAVLAFLTQTAELNQDPNHKGIVSGGRVNKVFLGEGMHSDQRLEEIKRLTKLQYSTYDDWDDPKIDKLLRKIYFSLPRQGALLVTETLIDDDHSGPVYTLMQDLNMLVCTDGRERTEAQYSALLRGAGFSTVQFRRTGSLVDAILAIKN